MSKSTFKLKILTPMFFMGGADPQGQPVLRAASIHGAMRFWFRTMAGTVVNNPQEVYRLESAVFENKAKKNKVVVKIKTIFSNKNFKRFKLLSHRRFTALAIPPNEELEEGEPSIEVINWCISKLDITGRWDYRQHRPKFFVKASKPGAILSVRQINSLKQPEACNIAFENGNNILAVKNLIMISMKNGKPYLADLKPELGEPNDLLVIKNRGGFLWAKKSIGQSVEEHLAG